MRGLVLIAFLLSLAPWMPAQETARTADTNAAAPAPHAPDLCSDRDKRFPRCAISKSDQKHARELFKQAVRASKHSQFDQAYELLRKASDISPKNIDYVTAREALKQKVVFQNIEQGNRAAAKGDTITAMGAFRHANEIDPTNPFALQRLNESIPPLQETRDKGVRSELVETRLRPDTARHSFQFKGSSNEFIQQFCKAFGIVGTLDEGLRSRPVRVKLDNVDWTEGSPILQRITRTLLIPMGDKQVFVVEDTNENRQNMVRMTLRTFYLSDATTPQEMNELTTTLRILFDLRYIIVNPRTATLVIRAPQQTMDSIAVFMDNLHAERPNVMLDMKVFQVSSTLARQLGANYPTQFTVFNIPSEINNVLQNSSYSSLLAQLQSSGLGASAIQALLLQALAGSSSLLTSPFVTFGGGKTFTGVSVAPASLNLGRDNSFIRTLDDVMLRASHASPATFRLGQRIPIFTSSFSESGGSGLLAQLGLTRGSSSAVPYPNFSYEDIGLTLKATPQIHRGQVTLNYELQLRSLGPTQSNGLPIIANREAKGSVTADDGQPILMIGSVDSSEVTSLQGIPAISSIPGLGPLFSYNKKQLQEDELLIMVTPHIVTSPSATSSPYIPIPTNIPR